MGDRDPRAPESGPLDEEGVVVVVASTWWDRAIRRQGASSIDEVERATLYPGGAVVVQLNEKDESATKGDLERLEPKIDQILAAQGT